MKVHEFVRLNKCILNIMQENGIKLTDYRYSDLFDDYIRMKDEGHKITYIVASLSNKYEIAERSIYKIMERMRKECKI